MISIINLGGGHVAMGYLPVDKSELRSMGKETVDFVLVTGDAYVDHPSFGAAIIGRILESRGYSVGIISQPDINAAKAFMVFGQPNLGFLVTGGNIDSMVNHYTVAKKPRKKDVYSPGGKAGLRPDRALVVYGNKIREAYKNSPIILGGLEASLRRLAHYDYWSNSVRHSVLLDSAGDLLVYGMGETQIVEIAGLLRDGVPVRDIQNVKGTVYRAKNIDGLANHILLPSYQEVRKDKAAYAESFAVQYRNTDSFSAKTLVEPDGNVYIVQNTPAPPLSREEFDKIYDLPFERNYHPMYESQGGVPAIEEVKFSVTSNRGCFGGCHFCALTFHQGRVVQSRSHRSIIREVEEMTKDSAFKGYIHDVGGPTANFQSPACAKQARFGACPNKQCLHPKPCKEIKTDHSEYAALLEKLRNLPKIKKVFIRSGIRFDYLMLDSNDQFFHQLVKHHISGQLKVAPEHVSAKTLDKMGKPRRSVYDAFTKKYEAVNRKLGMNQYLVPYFMSSHPGCDIDSAVELAEYIRDWGHMPEQVQDFYPTPGTLSTCMYYTEMDPFTKEKVYVPKNPHEKAMQRALMQFRLPQNYGLVHEALLKAGRRDLIGFDKKCLIRPKQQERRVKKDVVQPVKKKKTIRNIHKKKQNA